MKNTKQNKKKSSCKSKTKSAQRKKETKQKKKKLSYKFKTKLDRHVKKYAGLIKTDPEELKKITHSFIQEIKLNMSLSEYEEDFLYCWKKALKSTTRGEYKENFSGCYKRTYKHQGWREIITVHMVKLKHSKKECMDSAKPYIFVDDWKDSYLGYYKGAQYHKIMRECTEHMVDGHLKHWTCRKIDQYICNMIADDRIYLKDLREGKNTPISTIYKNLITCNKNGNKKHAEIWQEFLDRFKRVEGEQLKLVYVYIVDHVDGKQFYVGITCQPDIRKYNHAKSERFIKIEEEKKIGKVKSVEFIKLTSYLEPQEAAKLEQDNIEHYESLGYKKLNKIKGGGLGGLRAKFWTDEKIHEYLQQVLKEYKTWHDVIKNEYEFYYALGKHPAVREELKSQFHDGFVKGTSITVGGHDYISIRQVSDKYEIDPSLAVNRMRNLGWTPDEAFGVVERDTNNGLRIKVEGKEYDSRAAAARAHNLNPDVVNKRLWNGWSIEEAFFLADRKLSGIKVTVEGKEYPTLKAAAIAYGKKPHNVQYHVRNGKSIKEALGIAENTKEESYALLKEVA